MNFTDNSKNFMLLFVKDTINLYQLNATDVVIQGQESWIGFGDRIYVLQSAATVYKY